METLKKERIRIYQKRNTCFVGIDMHKDMHCAVAIDCWMNKIGEVNFEIDVELERIIPLAGYKLRTMPGIDLTTEAHLISEIGDSFWNP